MGRHHARVYAELPEARLVGIVDPSLDASDIALRFGVPRYSDIPALLARADVRAVSIAVPTPGHFEIARMAITAGLHVLIEKPIASTLVEARALAQLAQDNDVLLTVGHVERFNPVIRALRQHIAQGGLGVISSLVARRVGGLPARMPNTDVVVDLAVHDLDVFQALMKDPVRLLAAHASRTFHPTQNDSAELLVEVGPASGFVQVNWITPVKNRTLVVTGSGGVAEVNYVTQELVVHETPQLRSMDSFEEFVTAFGSPNRRELAVTRVEPLKAELLAFLTAVSTGDVGELVTAADATSALGVALEAAAWLAPTGKVGRSA
jgi:UDP-N-acetylglucosamine 3-dehydrogenase